MTYAPLRRRLTVGAAAVLALVLPAAAAALASAPRRLPAPNAADLARASAQVTEGVLLGAQSGAYWGGPYTASTGETVTVYVSASYPQDPAVGQKWADFVASLVHGPEIATVQLYLVPLRDVQAACGAGALACYDPQRSTLFASPVDPASNVSAEAVVAHEYGHHVAAHRSNAPWTAVDWGTKRWATYERVCTRTRAGTLFPGDENRHYEQNPGEAFAESYRVLNERRLGTGEAAWKIVDDTLYPDASALSLLQQDVTNPWQGPSTTSVTGTLARTRTFTVATPLDGNLTLALRLPARARTRLDLLAANGAVVARGATSIRTTVCGTRSYRVRVTRLAGAGAYRLSVTKP